MPSKLTRFFIATLIVSLCVTPAYALAKIEESHEIHREKLLHLFSGEWISRGIYTATKLGIPEALEAGPKSIVELSKIADADTDSLYRLLHMLAGHGIFQEDAHQIFSNTEESAMLSVKHPNSLHSLCIFYGQDIHKAWDSLLPSIQQGIPAFELSFQQPVFGYFKNNPDKAILFQAAMKEKSQAVIKSALSAFDFSPFDKIVDIGGGHGQFLSALVHRYPHVSATLFELPEVVEKLPMTNLNMELSRGDFFKQIPQNKDLYILKSVLHDWDDDRATQILQNCHQAMNEKSRLLIVEVVLQPKDQSLYANNMDLLMLAITGGKERSLASFEEMLEKSHLTLENIHPTSTEFSILEVKKSYDSYIKDSI